MSFSNAEFVAAHLNGSAAVKHAAATQCASQVETAVRLIADSLRKGGKLLICGNGGSAADAQHFAAEFVCRLSADFERPALAAIALTTDTSLITAYSNDYGFEGVFARQVEALATPSDVLFGISTSGSSKNVVRAFEAAAGKGASTVALVGNKGILREMATAAICVPTEHQQYMQEAHLAIEHIICALVERELFPKAGTARK